MRVIAFLIGGVLLLSAWAVQIVFERTYVQPAGAQGAMPYARMSAMLRLLGIPFPAVAADISWIVAVQHFASLRHASDPAADKGLFELVDLTVTLDPAFVTAYRTGAVFLAEPPPIGPGDVGGALGVLRKGIAVLPERWELRFDEGFLQYRSLRRYAAAASFLSASRLSGAPWWLKPLAANTLTEGGRRAAARALWRAQLDASRPEWMRRQAERRLEQLDALDEIDRLQGIVDKARRGGLPPPYSWDALRAAGRLRVAPLDPAGTPYLIGPKSGRVTLSPVSPLAPLPTEGGFAEQRSGARSSKIHPS